MFAAILVGSLAAALAEYRILLRAKRYREIAVSAFLLAIGLTLGILYLRHVNVPSPLQGITGLFRPASKLLAKWLS